MKSGDLVIIHGEFPNVPLYPLPRPSRPFLAQPGDLVILLDDIHRINHGYVKVLHPVGGICDVSKWRLDLFWGEVPTMV